LLTQFGVQAVSHYAPLHYLPFIARRAALLSKTRLLALGFSRNHFRSTSREQDEQRGFGQFVHLTLQSNPPILRAKLQAGFPHFEVSIPAQHFEGVEYLLCRFNIAKTRHFRGARRAPVESKQNGKYLRGLLLPVAQTFEEREQLLQLNLGKRMIEVLVREQLRLLRGVAFRFFHEEDLASAAHALTTLNVNTYTLEQDATVRYTPSTSYRAAVRRALEAAVSDSSWLGEALEFDRV
jgi:hypothetical protein